jgi:DNA invertase Pin-like site-specific DNA recombinase
MNDGALVPAATYLRMSTEWQQYSLINQSEVIAQYADAHGFTVISLREACRIRLQSGAVRRCDTHRPAGN